MAYPGGLADMIQAAQGFHDKYRLRENGGEDLTCRVALMTEEVGEISTCITKGGNSTQLAEELADLLIFLPVTRIVSGTDLHMAFWDKIEKMMNRPAKMITSRMLVSDFHNVD